MAAAVDRCIPAVALIVALLAVPTAAADAGLGQYHTLPTEHDDLGRVDEPDFATTGVLGAPLQNCVLSFNPLAVPGLGRACTADSALPPATAPTAPGCTDDAGRQPSGLCALWSNGVHIKNPDPESSGLIYILPPHTVGIQGMSGNAAPGGYTPTKGHLVRLLDIQPAVSLPATGMIEVNRKLADSGARALLGGADPALSSPVIPNAAALWAWYGVWQDKNGNGVVDHLDDAAGHALPTNEFRWVGNCLPSGGTIGADLCLAEPGLVFPVWVYPGNHHQTCGFLIGCYAAADHPGRQLVCFTAFYILRDPRLFNCLPAGDFDAEERDSDPLLGPGEARVAADGEMGDGTGSFNATVRLWDFGLPPGYYYDQSLLTTTVIVGGPTLRTRDDGLATRFDLGALQFVDVDRYEAWLPVAGDLLQTTLRPSARGPWVLVRDSYALLGTTLDASVNQRGADAPTHALASVDDALRDPGWSREPNHALDRYPGTVFGAFAPGGGSPTEEQRHRGWLNDYAGNAAAWRAWADVHAARVQYTYGQFGAGPVCLPPPCAIGGGFWDAWSVLPGQAQPFPRGAGDHGRSLEPGLYQFRGFAGAWRDAAHPMLEQSLDLAASVLAGMPVVAQEAYVLPPDGWLGNIVNTTGAFRYRGYGPETCFLHGQSQTRAWAVCNPYLDTDAASLDSEAGLDQSFGLDLSDPQDPLDAREFQVLTAPPAQARVVLRPAGGTWTFPVFVWRDFYHWGVGNAGAFVDFTGTTQPIVLDVLPQLEPALRSRVATQDLLLVPLGNQGQGVTSEFAFRVRLDVPSRGIAVDETVVDVDAYRAWGVPGALI